MKTRHGFYLIGSIFIIFTTAIMAQNPIPNAGFENWSGGEPVGWFSGNIPGFENITQSSDNNSGASAVRGEVIDLSGLPWGPGITTGSINDVNFPVSQKYARLTGFYKFSPVGTDELSIAVDFKKNNGLLGVGVIKIQNPATAWTPFSIDISFSNQEIPDAASITVSIGNTTGVNIGSIFLLDDLQFEDPVGIEDQSYSPIAETYALKQNYPNPFNPSTTIEFSLKHSGDVQLSIFNSLGQEVARVIDEPMAKGFYSITWNAEDLPGGIYFYRLSAGEFSETKKFALVK